MQQGVLWPTVQKKVQTATVQVQGTAQEDSAVSLPLEEKGHLFEVSNAHLGHRGGQMLSVEAVQHRVQRSGSKKKKERNESFKYINGHKAY